MKPGDAVFSIAESCIKAIGIVEGAHFSANRSVDFGVAGNAWDSEGGSYLLRSISCGT